jgi:hypothetical protein
MSTIPMSTRTRDEDEKQRDVNCVLPIVSRRDESQGGGLEVSLGAARVVIENFDLRINSNWVFPWSLRGKGGAELQLTPVQAAKVFQELLRYRGGSFGYAYEDRTTRFLADFRDDQTQFLNSVTFSIGAVQAKQHNAPELPPHRNPNGDTVPPQQLGLSGLVQLIEIKPGRAFRLADDVFIRPDESSMPIPARCDHNRCQRIGQWANAGEWMFQCGTFFLDIPLTQLVQPLGVSWVPLES